MDFPKVLPTGERGTRLDGETVVEWRLAQRRLDWRLRKPWKAVPGTEKEAGDCHLPSARWLTS
jgi:hypothetical protein